VLSGRGTSFFLASCKCEWDLFGVRVYRSVNARRSTLSPQQILTRPHFRAEGTSSGRLAGAFVSSGTAECRRPRRKLAIKSKMRAPGDAGGGRDGTHLKGRPVREVGSPPCPREAQGWCPVRDSSRAPTAGHRARTDRHGLNTQRHRGHRAWPGRRAV